MLPPPYQMPDEVSKKLGEANMLYATRRYKEAIELLNDVIKEVSHQSAAYIDDVRELFSMTSRSRKLTRFIGLLPDMPLQCPNFADPFHTLGLVHEADGNVRRALDFYMIAAHLTPKVRTPWGSIRRRRTSVTTRFPPHPLCFRTLPSGSGWLRCRRS